MFIKLNKNVKADNGEIFAKGSILQILTSGTKSNPEMELMPINAKDEEGLPYNNGRTIYTFSKLTPKSYIEMRDKAQHKIAYITVGSPASAIEDDDSATTIALLDAFSEKDYEWDTNGIVTKKSIKKRAEGDNNLTDSQSEISTDFDASIDGQDDPGVTDNYKEDLSNHEAPSPILGPLAKRLNFLKRKLRAGSSDNNLLGNDADVSIDFDKGVDGSGTVTDNYSSDESAHEAEPPILGKVPAKRKKKSGVEGDEFSVKITDSGDSGGDNLDDFSQSNNVDESDDDTFRLQEGE